MPISGARGGAREPYFNHLAEVAALLSEATEGEDVALVAACFLHDTIEDTATSRTSCEKRSARTLPPS